MFVMNEEGHIRGFLHHATSTLSHQQAIHVACTFNHALAVIIANPSCGVDELDLVSTRGVEQIKSWNSHVPSRVDRCVHHMITERSISQPDQLAISSWDGQVTYQELNDRSSQLAKYLVSFGIGPETISLYCLRSPSGPLLPYLE